MFSFANDNENHSHMQVVVTEFRKTLIAQWDIYREKLGASLDSGWRKLASLHTSSSGNRDAA